MPYDSTGRDPYQPPAADLLAADEADLPGWSDAEARLAAAFVGPRWDVYAKKWRRLAQERSAYAGFCWPAFLFGAFWFFYRRMYAIGLGVFVAYVVLQGALLQLLPTDEDALGNGVSVALSMALGLVGHYAYYRFAHTKLRGITAVTPDPAERAAIARQRGGTSWIAVAVVAVATVAALVLAEWNA